VGAVEDQKEPRFQEELTISQPPMYLLSRYLLALLLTIAIEGGIAYLLGLRKRQYLLAVVMVNVITHVILNYLLLVLGYLNIATSFGLIVALEIGVTLIEWQLLVYVFSEPKGLFLRVSILGNAASFLMGILLFW
jgi:hypothetical protein